MDTTQSITYADPPTALPAAPAQTINDLAPDTLGTPETPTAASRETTDLATSATPDIATAFVAPDAHVEAAGRGIARLMRHDRARFLSCVERVGDSDRAAMAGALELYLTAQTRHIFTSAPISADRILAFWAHESAAAV